MYKTNSNTVTAYGRGYLAAYRRAIEAAQHQANLPPCGGHRHGLGQTDEQTAHAARVDLRLRYILLGE